MTRTPAQDHLENLDIFAGSRFREAGRRSFRVGHLGSFNDLMLAGTLSGIEMGLRLAGVPHRVGGVMAALNVLAPPKRSSRRKRRDSSLS